MPHLRDRFLSKKIEKYLKFWPVIGLIGMRQTGKTTLISNLLTQSKALSLDELELRNEARNSPKTFLARQARPVILDEAQKAPEIFDAIKLLVDKKRIPGEFILTGSSSFSTKIGIKESLTGRIGIAQLRPLTMAELHQKPLSDIESFSIEKIKPRFTSSEIAKAMQVGGMPGVCFIRESENRSLYWESWLETTLTRDLPRLFKRGYDPDLALSILQRMAKTLREGELPTLNHFSQPARKINNYLEALSEIFVIQKISMHEEGFGKPVWIFGDSGLAKFLMKDADGVPGQLSLIRHFLWNEWLVRQSLATAPKIATYYKSAQGSPVDAIIGDTPVLITADAAAVASRLSWIERPLRGAMKKLGASKGVITAPIDHVIPADKNSGVAVVPWGFWS